MVPIRLSVSWRLWAAAGGLFIPSLCFPLLSAQAGIERSTGCRRWDSRVFSVSCRSGLNDPPAAAGGIWLNVICGVTNGVSYLGIDQVASSSLLIDAQVAHAPSTV